MDPLTHALSGAIVVQCLPKEVRSLRMTLWGALVAMSPDVDVVFCRTPLQYIEWHRGFSHSFVGTALLAVLCAWALLWLMQREKPLADANAARHGWTFTSAWWLAFGILLLHVWLDCVTSYGTQILQPFSEYRSRLSGLFIVDPVLILGMGLGLAFFARNRKVMGWLLAVVVLVYPAAASGLRWGLEEHMAARLPKIMEGRTVLGVDYTPEAFAPFLWKMVVDTPDAWLVAGPLTPCSAVPTAFTVHPKPDAALWQALRQISPTFDAYARFAQFPWREQESLLQTLPEELRAELGSVAGPFTEKVYTDVRFGSSLEFVRRLQGTDAKETEKTFRISSIQGPDGRLLAVRFRVVRGAGGDSGWVPVKAELR